MDLNADLGEEVTDDAALLRIVTSANVACGYHAGSAEIMRAEIMRAVYFETLKRIERRDYDVFSSRTRVPKPRQALIAIRQWIWPT